jgi:alpha-beta hydrolase superfamily lysophospholipase
MKRNSFFILGVMFILTGCIARNSASQERTYSQLKPEETYFRTSDGWRIHADFYPAPKKSLAVVLLHQRNGDAKDWLPLIPSLIKSGISALAVDQRGAGKSLGAENGVNAPWDTTKDIEASVKWLQSKGFHISRITLIGASYGANNALIYASNHPDIRKIILLSPGSNYHGLIAAPPASAYKGEALVLWSQDDPIVQSGPQVIRRAMGDRCTLHPFSGDIHGTDMFHADPDSLPTIVRYLIKAD